MCKNFIIAERYKSRDFMLFHFIFIINYVRDKNALYGIQYRLPFESINSCRKLFLLLPVTYVMLHNSLCNVFIQDKLALNTFP